MAYFRLADDQDAPAAAPQRTRQAAVPAAATLRFGQGGPAKAAPARAASRPARAAAGDVDEASFTSF